MRSQYIAMNQVMPLQEDAWLLLRNVLIEHQLPKGDLLLQPGQVCKHIFFLQTGLMRSFYLKDGEERNVAFTLENGFVTDLKSLRSAQPSELSIQALEPSTLFSMPKNDLLQLYEQSHQLESFGRRLLETLLEEQEDYAAWFTLYSAKERYNQLLKKQPALVQRVSLGHLASFLGIRRETLSRIRKLK
ncbi:Crp/Fnr family transcriptional regulator [Spirosoma aureum]|uniref:Crp/Fnr family transcriptional regulator n=1 Tax=Spirosoma aureum TaxID=2692134 RepID=A0A6G9AMP3_9BACT|nr:Crp/Fnr family transcriptional regulator [Spirosoma aureum]QIP13762.1 Crp/Fnr family transcriptional regulator [Spirosoma aureum]